MSEPQLLRGAPYFPVIDVENTADHYKNVLGFAVDYAAGSPAEFAILARDGLSIMLRRVAASDTIVPNEKQGGTWDVFFWVRDARTLHHELSSKGATVVYGPVVQESYRMLEFAVRDNAGYVIGFGQPLDA
jgi:hypothetical protein